MIDQVGTTAESTLFIARPVLADVASVGAVAGEVRDAEPAAGLFAVKANRAQVPAETVETSSNFGASASMASGSFDLLACLRVKRVRGRESVSRSW